MIREVLEVEKKEFNRLAPHPLQAWEWGEFREKTGVKVSRFGRYLNDGRIQETAQVTWHKIPRLPWRVVYWPKGGIPSDEMLAKIGAEAKKSRCLFVKIEPNVLADKGRSLMEDLQKRFDLRQGRPLFTQWSFWLDLTKNEEELLREMKSKTRYNVRYAQRKGVKVFIDNSAEAFEEYWRLVEETLKRQGFYSHDRHYHEKMFATLQPAGMANLFKAEWGGKTLVTWMVFKLNQVIYYPYGGSTREDKELQASSLMMWEVMRWGKKTGAKIFDLWGSPGPDPKPSDPWFGFHRFKLGFGAQLVEFAGSYDLVVSPWLYPLYQLGNNLRWIYLRLKARWGI